MSLYARSAAIPPVPQGWTLNGCLADSAENRVLSLKTRSPDMTVATCLDNCQKDGAKYGGVEGTECYCGNTLNGENRLDDSRCSSICGGGGASGCG